VGYKMANRKYLTESENKFAKINEREYQKRALLDYCKRVYISNKYCTYEQKRDLGDYYNHLVASGKAKSPQTVRNQIASIALFAREIKKPFSMITSSDMNKYIAGQMTKCKFNTVNTRKDIIKRFFEWLGYEKVVEHIVIKPMEENKLRKEDLLSAKEVRDMLFACAPEIMVAYNATVDSTKRDRLIISTIDELGYRASEGSNINIGDIEDKNSYALITLRGKTGERTLPIVRSLPYLRKWLEIHPFRYDKDAPLFISAKNNEWGRRLLGTGIWRIIKKTAKRAGINKRVYPHLFRHTRATYFAIVKKWSEKELRLWFGWKHNSDMPNRYVHFAQEQVNKKYIREMGVFDEDEEEQNKEDEKLLELKTCSNCSKKNPITATYCECGFPLDMKEFSKHNKIVSETDNIMNELFSDKEFKDLVKEFLKRKVKK